MTSNDMRIRKPVKVQAGCRAAQILVVACIVVAGVGGLARGTSSLSVSLTKKGITPGEALLLGAVGSAYDLDTEVLLSYHSETGTTEGAVSIFYTSEESGIDADIILRERKRGKSWDAIAEGHGLPPGLRGKWQGHPGRARHLDKRTGGTKRAADPYEVSITLRFLSHYYSLDEERLILWIDAGLTLEDVALVLNLSARKHVDAEDVAQLRLKEYSWKRLAGRYGLTVAEISEPVPSDTFLPVGGHPDLGGNPGKGKSKSKK